MSARDAIIVDEQVRRVLIFRTGSIGDTVVALPAFHLIERAFPNAERVLLTKVLADSKTAPVAAMLDQGRMIHGVMEYPDGKVGLRELAALRRRIRAFAPDVMVYLPFSRSALTVFRDRLFFRLSGIPRVIGVGVSADQRNVRFDAVTGRHEFEVVRLLRSLGALGWIDLQDRASWDFRFSTAEHARAEAAFGDWPGRGNFMTLCIGAKVDVKQWGMDRWQALVDLLAKRHPLIGLACIGAGIEREDCDRLLAGWPGPTRNLCGELSPRESGVVLQESHLYVGNDSGPMHIAAAVGTPCVIVFSAHNLTGKWFPYGDAHRILHRDVPCQGCLLSTCEQQGKRCMREISALEVADAVSERLARRVKVAERFDG